MTDDVADLRMYLGEGNEGWTDDQLTEAIREAKAWIVASGRRWSWKVVASNVLHDGVPSPRMTGVMPKIAER